MSDLESKNLKKKTIANEIIFIFKKLKHSIIIGIIFFFGFSIYNNLISYTFFDKNFAWFEAKEILGYEPSQYNFVPYKNQERGMFDPVSGSMKISEKGRQEVKKEIIKRLFEESLIFILIITPTTLVILLLTNYIKRTINWTKKYAD